MQQEHKAGLHWQSGMGDLDDSFELAAALAEISSTMATENLGQGSSPLDGSNSQRHAALDTNPHLDHASVPEPTLLPEDNLSDLLASPYPLVQTGSVSFGDDTFPDNHQLEGLAGPICEDSPRSQSNTHDWQARSDPGPALGSDSPSIGATSLAAVQDREAESSDQDPGHLSKASGGNEVRLHGSTPSPVDPSEAGIDMDTADGYERAGLVK